MEWPKLDTLIEKETFVKKIWDENKVFRNH